MSVRLSATLRGYVILSVAIKDRKLIVFVKIEFSFSRPKAVRTKLYI